MYMWEGYEIRGDGSESECVLEKVQRQQTECNVCTLLHTQVQASEGSLTGRLEPPQCVMQSTLFLVDLAGSERVGEAGTVGEAAKEGASINNR